MTKVICYPRVSTKEQDDHGHSLPTQLAGLVDFAQRNSLTPVGEDGKFSEDYTGMVPLSQRPVGSSIVAALEKKEADGILVYRVDRLSRDVIHLMQTVREFREKGWKIYVEDHGLVKDELDIFVLMSGWMAHKELEGIREKTSRGRVGKAKAGRVVGASLVPYGYKYTFIEGRTKNRPTVVGLGINESEATVVRQIYQLYLYGEDGSAPLSAWAIAGRLNDMKIPPPGSRRKRSKRDKGLWVFSTILWILSNETYRGTYRYGRTVGEKRKGRKERPLTETIAVEVPALVNSEDWDAAQKRRAQNVRGAKRSSKRDYILRGMAYCSCGRPLWGYGYRSRNTGGKYYYYYRCSSRSSDSKSQYQERDCKAGWTPAEPLEEAAWKYAACHILSSSRFSQALDIALQQAQEAVHPKQAELTLVEKAVQETDDEMRLLVAQMGQVKGRAAELKQARLEELNGLYEQRAARAEALRQELYGATLSADKVDRAVAFQRAICQGFNLVDPTMRRQILEMLNAKVAVNGKQFSFDCRLKVSTGVDSSTSRGFITNRVYYWLVWRGPSLAFPLPPDDEVPLPTIWVERRPEAAEIPAQGVVSGNYR